MDGEVLRPFPLGEYKMVDKLYLDHQDINRLQNQIVRDITISGWKPELVIGLTRGGLAPAVCMSHWFNIPMMPIRISFRDWVEQQDLNVLVEKVLDRTNILIIDDINDTGKSLTTIQQVINERVGEHVFTSGQVKTAALVNNLGSVFEVDYVGMEIDKREQDRWIVFPWEAWWGNM